MKKPLRHKLIRMSNYEKLVISVEQGRKDIEEGRCRSFTLEELKEYIHTIKLPTKLPRIIKKLYHGN